MKILVGCEESQAVCIAFRERGHEAFSCDLEPCSGGHPEWHLQMDVFEAIKLKKWGMGIFFPPCTFLTIRSSSWCNVDKYGQKAIDRIFKRHAALEVVMRLYYSDIPRVAIENPVGYLNTAFQKPSQIIEPYYFGDPDKKRTCLWLKNLPVLKHFATNTLFETATHIDKPEPVYTGANSRKYYFVDAMRATEDRARLRSKTFPGIANAMADQWSNL